VVTEIGKPLEIHEVDLKEPKEDEVLIKVESATINPSDLAYIAGKYLENTIAPFSPGFEGSGVVLKAGGKAGEHLIGKKVGFTGSGVYG